MVIMPCHKVWMGAVTTLTLHSLSLTTECLVVTLMYMWCLRLWTQHRQQAEQLAYSACVTCLRHFDLNLPYSSCAFGKVVYPQARALLCMWTHSGCCGTVSKLAMYLIFQPASSLQQNFKVWLARRLMHGFCLAQHHHWYRPNESGSGSGSGQSQTTSWDQDQDPDLISTRLHGTHSGSGSGL